MKFGIEQKILKICILLAIILVVVTGKSVLCDKQPESDIELMGEVIRDESPAIVRMAPVRDGNSIHGQERLDETVALLEEIHEIALQGRMGTAEGDSAVIIVSVDPVTHETAVSGEINGHPITGAEIEILIPVPQNRIEENGDVAVVIDQPMSGDSSSTAIGVSWEPINFEHGKYRLGLVGLAEIGGDHIYGGARGAIRWRNISAGVTISREFSENPYTRFGFGLGFYL